VPRYSDPGRRRDDDLPELRRRLNDRVADVARELLGEPNKALSSRQQLRIGRNGSVSVELDGEKRGQWYDHEVGEGGDMLDLVARSIGKSARSKDDFPMVLAESRRLVGMPEQEKRARVPRPRPEVMERWLKKSANIPAAPSENQFEVTPKDGQEDAMVVADAPADNLENVKATKLSEQAKVARARRIWSNACPLNGTLGEAYLKHRGLSVTGRHRLPSWYHHLQGP
jgi:hypothetical protein